MADDRQAIVQQQAKTVKAWLEGPSVQRELGKALRQQIKPAAVVRIIVSAMVRQQQLFSCSRESLWASVMRSLEIGLLPDGIEAALVPYKGVCTFQPMYQGLVKLATNAGATVLPPVIVHANEKFKMQLGSNPPFVHEPLPPSTRGEAIGAYAVCMVNDFPVGEFMWLEEINAVRDKSSGYVASKKYGKDSPWTTHPAEMQKKTVFKRLCKYLPKSAELAQAVASDDDAESGIIDMSPVIADGGAPALPEGTAEPQVIDQEPDEPEKPKAPAHDPCQDIRSEVRDAIKELGEDEAMPMLAIFQESQGCTVADCKDADALAKFHEDLKARKLAMANESAKARKGGATKPISKTNASGELIPGATQQSFKG